MANMKTGRCSQCGYPLPGKEILRCPRCNMSMMEKCLDCTGCTLVHRNNDSQKSKVESQILKHMHL